MFELLTPTDAELTSVTNRSELHGEDKVPAISLGLRISGANTLLDLLSPTLRPAIYERPEGQPSLAGIEETMPNLRTKGIDHFALDASFDGWTLAVDHGIDEAAPITFGGCKVDKFRCTAKEGGSVELSLRVGTSDIDAGSLGLIGMKLGQTISITLTAPKAAAAEAAQAAAAPAATPKRPKKNQPSAEEVFAGTTGATA